MKLQTERLELVPLKYSQLKLLTSNIYKFEKELNCKYYGEELKGELLEIFKGQVEIVGKSGEAYIWHTLWLFKLKNEDKFIGSACFKDTPNNFGEVEVGYGIGQEFENNGYTTEAINAMCKWALDKPYVKKIIAETEKWNKASQKVLKKCNMKIYKETEKSYWWYCI